MGYGGDTWSGEVTAANNDTREITLTYTNGKKTQTWTGIVPSPYMVKMKDKSERDIKR